MDDVKKPTALSRRLLFFTVISLAWPTMLEMMLQTAVQYIDTAMVGSLGTAATAAVGSTVTVNWLIGSTVSAVGTGFLAMISQAMGASGQLLPPTAEALEEGACNCHVVLTAFDGLPLFSPVIS